MVGSDGSQHFVWVKRVGWNGFPPPAAVWVISCEARTAARTFLFSSESVNEGHPDKLCDQARVLWSLKMFGLFLLSSSINNISNNNNNNNSNNNNNNNSWS